MFAGSSACQGRMRSARQPNIILFLVDDMGWQDTSVPFHSEPTVWNSLYRTPNMERLAERGMRFTQAYSASPVCSPTRVSMMTGKNPARTNVTDWVGHGRYGNQYVQAPEWQVDGLQPGRDRTLPELLRGAGYRTIHVGKGHFGARAFAGAEPKNLGFDWNVGGASFGSPGSYYGEEDYGLGTRRASSAVPHLEKYHGTETFLTEALTIEANARFFDAIEDVPTRAISMGIKNIMQSRKIVLIATGQGKAEAVKGMIEGPITPELPASVLQLHPDVTIILDEAAASLLSK